MLACVDVMLVCLYIYNNVYLGRFPFVFQKESFWVVKGLLLECKTNPFGMQKDPFWNAKGPLLECKRSPSDSVANLVVKYIVI